MQNISKSPILLALKMLKPVIIPIIILISIAYAMGRTLNNLKFFLGLSFLLALSIFLILYIATLRKKEWATFGLLILYCISAINIVFRVAEVGSGGGDNDTIPIAMAVLFFPIVIIILLITLLARYLAKRNIKQ